MSNSSPKSSSKCVTSISINSTTKSNNTSFSTRKSSKHQSTLHTNKQSNNIKPISTPLNTSLNSSSFKNKNSRQQKHSNYYMYLTSFLKPKSSSLPKTTHEVNFTATIERFEEYEKTKQTKINNLRQTRSQEKEKEIQNKPTINKRSKLIMKRKDNDNKVNKVDKDGNSSNNKSKLKGKRHLSLDLDKTINKMYEWETQRIERLKNKQKEKEQKTLGSIQSRPVINKKSKIMAKKINQNNNMNSTINRLYKVAPEKVNQKKILLQNILMPTFKPIIHTCPNKTVNSNKKKFTSVK